MMRWVFVAHRWTGIAFGIMAVVWLLSGIVIHWYEYAGPDGEEALRSYARPITVAAAGAAQLPSAAPDGRPIRKALLRDLGGEPAWLLHLHDGSVRTTDAVTGEPRGRLARDEARRIAAAALGREPGDEPVEMVTTSNEYYYGSASPLPAYRVAAGEDNGTDVYIEPTTGRVTAVIGTGERLTRLLGGAPHFLNVGPLHAHYTIRSVLLLALLAGVLVTLVSGLVYAIRLLYRRWQMERRPGRSWWRLRFMLGTVHIWTGIIAAIPMLGWTVSGFFMLNIPPLAPTASERAGFTRDTIVVEDFRVDPADALASLPDGGDPVVLMEAKYLLDSPVYEFVTRSGRATVVDAATARVITPISSTFADSIARAYVGGDVAIRESELLDQYDTYYYVRRDSLPLPVHRITLERGHMPSAVYVDARTGEVSGRVTREYRNYRWLVGGLHTWDYRPLLLNPPWWDIAVVAPALLGVILTISGLWLGLRHLRTRRRRPAT